MIPQTQISGGNLNLQTSCPLERKDVDKYWTSLKSPFDLFYWQGCLLLENACKFEGLAISTWVCCKLYVSVCCNSCWDKSSFCAFFRPTVSLLSSRFAGGFAWTGKPLFFPLVRILPLAIDFKAHRPRSFVHGLQNTTLKQKHTTAVGFYLWCQLHKLLLFNDAFKGDLADRILPEIVFLWCVWKDMRSFWMNSLKNSTLQHIMGKKLNLAGSLSVVCMAPFTTRSGPFKGEI